MSSPGWGTPGRASRQPADETRRAALSTALSMIAETGLTVSLEHLSIEDLIRTAGLPRSTFYRLWPAKERFFADLLVELATVSDSHDAMFYPETQVAANEVIEGNLPLLGSHGGRVAVLREAVRIAGRMNFEHFSASVGWRTHVTLITTAGSLVDEDTRGRLVAALQTTEKAFIERTAQFYGSALSALGFSFRPGATAELLAGLGASVVEGLAQRRLVNPDLTDTTMLLPGLDGRPVPWHPAALGFWGVLETLVDLEEHEGGDHDGG
ncbi:MAG: TetR/AcrR family transcriptional regulator [Microbacterium sp.]|uniref:TetR/AcrR family transcriptional regulator n=1 Tax=unclassified Microbacterium TaxID=2609290 RepID=UPI000A729468|nr:MULTISPECIES: TetR/AcrR family transcriptional regulator [unclassified Microbacterium]MBN9212435.1 TetR/AcrR family transcriptional regulator [Microbacterium sp.]